MSEKSLILVSESKESLSEQLSDEQILMMVATLIGAAGSENRTTSESIRRGLFFAADLILQTQGHKSRFTEEQEYQYSNSMSPRAKWEYINKNATFIRDLFRALLNSSDHNKELRDTFRFAFINELDKVKCTHGRFVNGCAYKLHPHEDGIYIPVAEYHQYILKSKKSEFLKIMSALGAKKLSLIEHNHSSNEGSFNAEFSEPTGIGDVGASASNVKNNIKNFSMTYETHEPPSVLPVRPPGLKWIMGEPIWNEMIEARLAYGVSKFGASFSNTSDFGLDASVVAQIKGIGFSLGGKYKSNDSFEQNYQVEFWPIDQCARSDVE